MLFRTVLIIVLTVLIGFGAWQYNVQQSNRSVTDTSALEHAEKHLDPNYVCPMHPTVVSDEPGSCPVCGMDLEQKKTSSDVGSGVQVSAAMQRSLGVSTSKVDYGPVVEEAYATGAVERVTPPKVSSQASAVTGTVTDVLYKKGDWISEDAPVIVIDSPEYTALLSEYLEAREEKRHRDNHNALQELIAIGADRVVLVQSKHPKAPRPPKQLNLLAKQSGVIDVIHVKKGDKVEITSPLVKISAPKLYEVIFRSYSRAARKIEVGNKIKLKLPGHRGKTWIGQVIHVQNKEANFYTAITGAFELPKHLVTDRMFVGGNIETNNYDHVLRVPASAIIYGNDKTHVIRKHEAGYFVPLDVKVGRVTTDWVEILSGLKAGGLVVTRGQFMIDSEASLQAGLQRLSDGDEDL